MSRLIGKLDIKHLPAFAAGAFLLFALACSSQPAPAPAPEPGIDPNQLSQLVQDAVARAVPEQPDVPAPVSADEIQRMVEVGIAAAVPEGASPKTLAAMSNRPWPRSTSRLPAKRRIGTLMPGPLLKHAYQTSQTSPTTNAEDSNQCN